MHAEINEQQCCFIIFVQQQFSGLTLSATFANFSQSNITVKYVYSSEWNVSVNYLVYGSVLYMHYRDVFFAVFFIYFLISRK